MALTKVNLANTVEGILPVANGGTGTSTGVAPGGSTTQVQYNNAGVFAGSSSFVFDGTNVGIGTSSPSTKLDVSGTSRYTFNVANAYTLQTSINAAGSAFADDYKNAAQHIWQTSGTERMRIDSSGNVGIGTSSPSNKFEVFGNSARNTVRANSTAGDVLIEAQAVDYWSTPSYTGTSLRQSGSTATGTYAGLSNASLGSLIFQNGSAGLIATNGGAPLVFATLSTEQMRIDSSGNLLFNSGYGSVATAYGCRAWVNFNGTGTVAIRASGNVSSITDNGTGDYTINFTNAMPDANYSVTGTTSPSTGISNIPAATLVLSYATAPTTSARRIFTGDSRNGGFQDCEYINVAIHR